MKRFSSWLWPAIILYGSTSAMSQSYQDRVTAEGAAGAVVAYEQVREKCFSEQVINDAFRAIDRDFKAAFPRNWEGMKAQANTTNRIMLQTGLVGSDARNDAENTCKVAARLMQLGIVYVGMRYFMAYPGLEQALKQRAENASGSFLQQNQPPSLSTPPPQNPDVFQLSKTITENVFSCLRNDLSSHPEPKFSAECPMKAIKEFDLSAAQIFRIEYIIYERVHKWAVDMKAPVTLPDPDRMSADCNNESKPIECMFRMNWLAFSALIKIINDYKNPDALESLRAALVEQGR